MKISRLRRALAVLLSAAMLIMCMPTVGITAAAAGNNCRYATITTGNYSGDDIGTAFSLDELV
ncbi:MAG: hypothetical protein ACI4XF_11230, partial [Oscillospiraceae bacterium]